LRIVDLKASKDKTKIRYHEKEGQIISLAEYQQSKYKAGAGTHRLMITLFLQNAVMKKECKGVPVTFLVATGAPKIKIHSSLMALLNVNNGQMIDFIFCPSGSVEDAQEKIVSASVCESRRLLHEGINLMGQDLIIQLRLELKGTNTTSNVLVFDMREGGLEHFTGESDIMYRVQE
jgi:hypothetical protein